MNINGQEILKAYLNNQEITSAFYNSEQQLALPVYTPFILEFTVTAGQTIRLDATGELADGTATISNNNDFFVRWGDGTESPHVKGNGNTIWNGAGLSTHTYVEAGTYQVEIVGQMPIVNFSGQESNPTTLTDIIQWGTNRWEDMAQVFRGCLGLTDISATDAPNLSNLNPPKLVWSTAGSENSPTFNVYGQLDGVFRDCTNLTNINFMSNWDMSQVENIYGLFRMPSASNRGNLTDWSAMQNWNMSKIKYISVFNLYSMFDDTAASYWKGWRFDSLESLTYLSAVNFFTDLSTVSNWLDNNNGTLWNIQSMLSYINADLDLTHISNWDVSSVTHAGWLLLSTSSLTSIGQTNLNGLENWNTSNFKHMNSSCSTPYLSDITAISNWDFSNVENASFMFFGNTSLTTMNTSNWSFPNLVTANFMFKNMRNCPSLDVSNWGMGSLQKGREMFNTNDFNLRTLEGIENWDMGNVTTIESIFQNCKVLSDAEVDNWDTSNILNMRRAFYDCDQLDVSLANWTVSQATNLSQMMTAKNPGISTPNYDATLISWAAQIPLLYNGTLDFGSSKYSLGGAAEAARTALIADVGAIVDGGGVVETRFIITVKTDNAGTSNSDQFTIPISTSGITQAFLYDIETSDGQTITGNTGDTTITFPSAGTYDIFISGSFPYIYFNYGGDRLKLLDIKNFGIYALGSTSQERAFRGCSNMVITAVDSGNFGSVTNFGSGYNTGAWQNCSSLTSFPLIDTSNAITISNAWNSCSSLTSFPLIDTSSVTNFSQCWAYCSSLTSFPLIDTSSGTNFKQTWLGNANLTSFPLINTSSGTNFNTTWASCSSLTSFPANAFDTNIATNYTGAFTSTNLSTQSIDDILVSLDTSGVSNGTFTQSGGQAPSATGEAAIDSLVGKGWTITVTGGYEPSQLLLDEYPNAAAAYSLRALSTSTVDSAVVRVRRSSDNTEQDFTATEITDGTLTTFTGANDGFVTTWYDQSGNSVNVVQASAASQPQLVDNGVVILDNGKPTVFYGLSSDTNVKALGTTSQYIIPQPTNYFSVARLNTDGRSFLFDTRLISSPERQLLNEGGGLSWNLNAGNSITMTSTPDADTHLFNALFNSLNSKGFLDSVETASGDAGLNSQDWGQLGSYQASNFQAISISEIIIYPSDQSANRTGIETNINTEYSIY